MILTTNSRMDGLLLAFATGSSTATTLNFSSAGGSSTPTTTTPKAFKPAEAKPSQETAPLQRLNQAQWLNLVGLTPTPVSTTPATTTAEPTPTTLSPTTPPPTATATQTPVATTAPTTNEALTNAFKATLPPGLDPAKAAKALERFEAATTQLASKFPPEAQASAHLLLQAALKAGGGPFPMANQPGGMGLFGKAVMEKLGLPANATPEQQIEALTTKLAALNSKTPIKSGIGLANALKELGLPANRKGTLALVEKTTNVINATTPLEASTAELTISTANVGATANLSPALHLQALVQQAPKGTFTEGGKIQLPSSWGATNVLIADMGEFCPEYFGENAKDSAAMNVLAAAIASTEFLTTGSNPASGKAVWNQYGGAGNDMKGPFQFNIAYHASRTQTPQAQTILLGKMLRGEINLPNSQYKGDIAGQLTNAMKSGAINSPEQLKHWISDKLGGSNWQGVDDGWNRNPGLAASLFQQLQENLL